MDHDLINTVKSDTKLLDRQWGVVAASTVGLTLSLGTLLLYTFGVFVRPLTTEFGWSRTGVSGALALSQYTLALTAPLWGYLIDRFGPRPVMIPSVVCISALVGSLAFLTPHLWHYYLIFAAVSFFAGGATPIGYSAILVQKFERHLGLALGFALMGVGIGAAVLPPLSQALMAAFGWREAYATLGGLTFILTLPAALIATRGTQPLARLRGGVPQASVLPLIKTRAFVLMCSFFVLLGIISIGTLVELVPAMIGRGFTPQAAAQLAGITGLVAIAGRGGIGWIMDRVHAPYVVVCIALLGMCACLLVGFGEGAGSAYLAAALLGAVVGAEVDFTAFFVRRYFGKAVFGRLYGIAFGIFIVGSGTGPLLASAMFEHFGSYQPGALLFAAGCVVIVMLALAMPTYKTTIPHTVAAMT
jgi:MFS family permease